MCFQAKLDPLPQLRVYQEKNQPKARVLSTAGSTASVKKRAPEQTPESRVGDHFCFV